MKKPPVATKHVVNMGVSALAREIGLSAAAVSKKMTAGMTAAQIRQEAARKKGQPPVGHSKGPGRPPLASEYDLVVQGRERIDKLEEMKFRKAKAMAERQELDNALKRGELVPVSYVRTWGSRFLTDARDTFMTGPSELQDVLAAESDPLQCAAILRQWLERAMTKFHQLESLWQGAAGEKVA
jgi:hypothetical protein